VFDTPSGDTIAVPVLEHRSQYVALLDNARETGFYLARVSLQAPGVPVAVNADTAESDVRSQSAAEVARRFEGTEIVVAQSEADLSDAVAQSRSGRSFWFLALLAVLGLLVIETFMASRSPKRPVAKSNSNPPAAASTENT
jgi:hypothetical protein